MDSHALVIKLLPKISIVIVTKNEEKDVPNLLDSVNNLKYPKNRMEVIVVDDSTDRTPEIIKKMLPNCLFIKGPGKGNTVAKNIGSKHATGEIILHLDADMVIDSDYVDETAKCYEDKNVGGTFHVEKFPHKNPNFIQKMLYLRKFIGWTNKVICIRSIRRDVFEKVGDFDPKFTYFDDWELGTRVLAAGYKIVTSKGIVWHYEIDSWARLSQQCRWMARSINFDKYKMSMLKKFGYSTICATLPISVLIFLFGGILSVAGLAGIFAFAFIELYRAFRIYYHSKDLEAFLMPFFDYAMETFMFIGLLQRLGNYLIK